MTEIRTSAVLDRNGLDALVKALGAQGRTVIAPTVRGGAVVLAELASADQLPYGWGSEVEAGHYRLVPREDGAAFAHTSGPQSWKAFLHPEREKLWSTDRTADGHLSVVEERPVRPSYALLGVRPCDLRAIAIQDRVLTGGRYQDSGYQERRQGAFLIAAECTEPGATCFCVSIGSGPGTDAGFDLALTELVDGTRRRSPVPRTRRQRRRERGSLPCPPPAGRPGDGVHGPGRGGRARDRMGRAMPPVDLRTLMGDSPEADRWNDVVDRCLACGNCTMVCPACFCTTTEEVTDLTGDHAERWQRWDSCFDLDFSYLHGGPVRSTPRGRYLQWLTHKLSTWHDQFGSTGCVGCGRCVTWRPVGIDITEEATALHNELEALLRPREHPARQEQRETEQ